MLHLYFGKDQQKGVFFLKKIKIRYKIIIMTLIHYVNI